MCTCVVPNEEFHRPGGFDGAWPMTLAPELAKLKGLLSFISDSYLRALTSLCKISLDTIYCIYIAIIAVELHLL